MNIINPYRYASALDLTSLVHYWRLESNSNDFVGSLNSNVDVNVTYDSTNQPPMGTNSGKWTRADDSRVGTPNASTLTGNEISWIIWVRKELVTNNLQIFQKRRLTPSAYDYAVTNNTSESFTSQLSEGVGNNLQVTSTGMFNMNTWVCYTQTLHYTIADASIDFRFKTYKNGVLAKEELSNSTFDGFLPTTAGLWIGSDRGRTGGDKSFEGRFSGFGIFDKELSSAEVLDIYNYMNSGNHLA